MMQAATHHNLLPPFSTPSYSNSSLDHKPVITSANGPAMQSQSMMPSSAAPTSVVRGNLRFSIVVEQQPIRARMCGFGDKDRRPITPPPCIRVVIQDATTGREVPHDEVDSTFFILQVDLWDENAQMEKNIVRASSNSPAVSISTATTTSFPPQPDRVFGAAQMYQNQYMSQPAPPAPYQQGYSSGQGLPPMYQPAPPIGGAYYGQSQYSNPYGQVSASGSPGYPPGYPGAPAVPYAAPQPQHSQGMFTRNLIGSLSVNAFTLNDPEEKTGHWFVLQDLSVRTEGTFRLKMNFIDVGTQTDAGKSSHNMLNQGKAPVLASVFSQPFQVYSAKKFPGVIESTPLSRCFAGQGIKIPIRKDGPKQEKDDDGED